MNSDANLLASLMFYRVSYGLYNKKDTRRSLAKWNEEDAYNNEWKWIKKE